MTAESDTGPTPPARPSAVKEAAAVLVPVTIGAAVAVALGVYGQVHEGTGVALKFGSYTGGLAFKSWLASGAVLFAVLQLLSALVMYGKLLSSAPAWIGRFHRWSGRAAFLLAVPVAVQCLYAIGFDASSPRTLVHSLLGCLFFGAFTVKMLVLSRDDGPGWLLPVMGGVVFTIFIALWLTSSVWYFGTHGFRI